jgi:hypothetical protein
MFHFGVLVALVAADPIAPTVNQRIDALETRMDRVERSLETRLDRIEQLLTVKLASPPSSAIPPVDPQVVQLPVYQYSTTQTCVGPNCPQSPPLRTGWYLGKNLGR